jgi:hypothetical protein
LLAEKGRLFHAHHSSSDQKITQSARIEVANSQV